MLSEKFLVAVQDFFGLDGGHIAVTGATILGLHGTQMIEQLNTFKLEKNRMSTNIYNYRWMIVQIEGYSLLNGMPNVVGKVHWELEVKDPSDHSVHYIRQSTELTPPTSDNFIDFLELDNEIILTWLWEVIGKETIETKAANELDAMREPLPAQLSTLPMPWMNSCCPDGTGIDISQMTAPAP